MNKKTQYKIEVRERGVKFGEPGKLIETITRIPWSEPMGNFSPIFCRYKDKKMLVLSKEGDLSDPFRRTQEYLNSLYIEITPLEGAALFGSTGGRAKSERKTAAVRLNGLKGGRPKGTGQKPAIVFPDGEGARCLPK